ncbi:MAG: 50S ribosomal protein L4 [Spirochaetia bacterium]|jgi:large subunit ribosomal protein L4|nr:50S ribosomal protein L4 [Spirochaetia bacterium]
MEAKVFSIKGEEIKTVELKDSVFNCDISEGTIYYAINNELANMRVGTASTKGRSEVRGSGAKPWSQKGTGRARSGHKRSPVWVGGGTVFGPKPKDYSFKMPKNMKKLALKSILSLKNKNNNLKIVEDFTIESGKTSDISSILANLVKPERTVIVLKDDDSMIKRAGRNIPWVSFLSYNRLRAHDLFYGKNILLMESAAAKLNDFYGKKQEVV